MQEDEKTKEQLIDELKEMRRRIAELEAAEARTQSTETERKLLQEALSEKTHELEERNKELNCLYSISKFTEKRDLSVDETLQGVVDLLPLSLQYPEITCVRIVFGGQEFKTENFGKCVSTQTANIVQHLETEMVLEVGYLEQRPEADDGPFLKEERRLINAIAEGSSALIQFKLVDGELKKSEERFRRAINATEDGLW